MTSTCCTFQVSLKIFRVQLLLECQHAVPSVDVFDRDGGGAVDPSNGPVDERIDPSSVFFTQFLQGC